MNYILRANPSPPKALVEALNRLKKLEEIFVTKPDFGSRIVVMANLSTSVFLAQLQSMMLPNLHLLMTNAQTFVDDHRNTFAHSFRKRKVCTQSCIKYCLKTLPLRFLRRVQDWPIFMGFPRHTKPN